MRTIQIALATGLTLTASASLAADMSEGYPVTDLRPSISDWTGAYVGGQVGYRLGRAKTKGLDPATASATPPDSGTARLDTVIGGLRGGYDHQINDQIVIGVAVDANYGSDSAKQSADLSATDSGEGRLKHTWDASARLRAGVLLNESLLAYGTGGVALLGEKLSASVTRSGDRSSFSDRRTHVGWTIGGGVEAALADNWRAFAEYRYAQFGSKTYDWDDEGVKAKSKPRTHTILTGVNYAF